MLNKPPAKGKRKALSIDLTHIVHEKAENRCQLCGKQLIVRQPMANKPKQEIEVEVWHNYPCYKCGHLNQVLTLKNEIMYSILWLERDDIGQELSRRYPFFRKGYSKTVGTSYYANHCTSCSALQGDWFISEWIIDQIDESNMIRRDHMPYSGERLDVPEEAFFDELRFPNHIHHKDGNPGNNSPENLSLLCAKCHRLTHLPPKK